MTYKQATTVSVCGYISDCHVEEIIITSIVVVLAVTKDACIIKNPSTLKEKAKFKTAREIIKALVKESKKCKTSILK